MALTLNIGYATLSPFRNPCAMATHLRRVQGKCDFPGHQAEMIDLIMRSAGFKFNLISIKPNRSAGLGFLATAYSMLETGEIDTFAFPFLPTTERLRRFKISYGISYEGGKSALDAVSPQSDPISDSLHFLTVFDNQSMIGIVVFLLAVQFFKLIGEKIQHKILKLHSKATPAKMLPAVVAWLGFFTALFVSLYRSGLLSSLLLKDNRPRFETLQELAILVNTGQVRIATPPQAAWMQRLSSTAPDLEKALERYPPIDIYVFGGYDGAAQYVAENPDSGIVVLGNLGAMALLSQKHCGLHMVRFGILDSYEAVDVLLFNKNANQSIIDRINQAIIRSNDYFLRIQARYEHYMRRLGRELCGDQQATGFKQALELRQLTGCFLLLIIGCLLAGGMILVEKFIRNIFGLRSEAGVTNQLSATQNMGKHLVLTGLELGYMPSPWENRDIYESRPRRPKRKTGLAFMTG